MFGLIVLSVRLTRRDMRSVSAFFPSILTVPSSRQKSILIPYTFVFYLLEQNRFRFYNSIYFFTLWNELVKMEVSIRRGKTFPSEGFPFQSCFICLQMEMEILFSSFAICCLSHFFFFCVFIMKITLF